MDLAVVAQPVGDEDMLQDESDFYSENGSPEKIKLQTHPASPSGASVNAVPPLSFDDTPADPLLDQEHLTDLNAIPGLGHPSTPVPANATAEHTSSPAESSSEDLYAEDEGNAKSPALQTPTAEYTVDDELGFTPEPVEDLESVQVRLEDGRAGAIVDASSAVDSQLRQDADKLSIKQDNPPSSIPIAQSSAVAASSSTTDAVFMAAAHVNASDPKAEWRFDSSDAESSSSGSSAQDSSDDSSDDESDADESVLLNPEQQARILMQESGDIDDHPGPDGPLRTANEEIERFHPKPDLIVTPEMAIHELGQVTQIVNNLAVIEANTSGEYRVLEAGSALCLQDRTVVGAIAETLGRVQEPRYTVGFPSTSELQESGLEKGTRVFYVEQHSSFVFTQPLRLAKGTDASNLHDEETFIDEMDFSDDEKEAEHKKALKLAKKEARELRNDTEGEKKPKEVIGMHSANDGFLTQPPTGPKNPNRGRSANRSHGAASQSFRKSHPDSDVGAGYSAPISYDDDDDEDMYRPLKRPDNLHEMMNSGAPPIQAGSRGRNDFRGGFGGRGGRHDRGGRGSRDRDRGRGGVGHRGGRDNHQKHWKEQRNETDYSPQRPASSSQQTASHHHDLEASPQPNAQHIKGGKRKFGVEISSPGPNKHSKSRHQPEDAPFRHSHTPPQSQSQSRTSSIPPPPLSPPAYSYTQSHQSTAAFYSSHPPSSSTTVSNLPAGAHVNPAFFMLQQLAQAQAQTVSPQAPPLPPPPPMPVAPPTNATNPLAGVNLHQLQQLAAMLQGGPQSTPVAPPIPPPAPPIPNHHLTAWQGYPQQQQQQQYQNTVPPRNDDAESRAAQDRLNAIINSYRATDPRR